MNLRLITLGLIGAACGGSTAPPESAGERSRQPSPQPAAPATPAASNTPPASPMPPESPFKVLGELPEEAYLFGAGQRGFVASQGGIVYALDGDEVVHDPLLQRGFSEEPMYSLEAITGSWPDSAWLSTTHPAGRTGFTKLWRWNGKRWAHQQSTTESFFIVGVRPWTGGRQLAVEQAGMMFDASFRLLSGNKNVTLPVIARRKNIESFCYTNIRVEAFDTLPSGEVFAAGLRCDDEEGAEGLTVARWAAGAKNATTDLLPDTGVYSFRAVTGLAVRSATDVYVSAEQGVWNEAARDHDRSTYLAHFDGSRWEKVPSKVPGIVKTLSLTADRQLLVTTDRGELYVGASFETLAALPLPAELFQDGLAPRVTSVWSHAPGDLWAIANLALANSRPAPRPTGSFYLLHTRPATKPLPTPQEFARKEQAYRLPGPPVDWCTTPFVLLYTLGKKAPADYDYPSTRAALKGQKQFAIEGVEFVEFERMGRRYFGARVPDFSLGKKLMTLVKEKVPGSTPELVCHDPPTLRKLTVDLSGAPAAK
ncbi:MAG TPA: hypothetical protein VGK73_27515 [Polyangiaceae bacterium]